MPVDVDGTLDKDNFAFTRADVDLYGGHTSASGKVTWGRDETYEVSRPRQRHRPGAICAPTCRGA